MFEPQSGKVVEGMYVVGWSRKASEGLVGVARFDAEQGASHILKYLESASERPAASPEEILGRLERAGLRVVAKSDLSYLGRAEEKQAKEKGLPSFKFADDATMLAVIEEEKTKAGSYSVVPS